MSEFGYIYIREHPSYDLYYVCKLGKTINISGRDKQYATGEIVRGSFTHVYKLSKHIVNHIDKLLQINFRKYNVKYDAGTEFYDKTIIDHIEPYLKRLGIGYNKLTNNKINRLLHCNESKKIISNAKIFKKISTVCTMIRSNVQKIYRIYKKNTHDAIHQYGYRSCFSNFGTSEYLSLPKNILQKNILLQKCVDRTSIESSVKNINTNLFNPRPDQVDIINKSVQHFQTNNKGILVMPCGVGKTLLSLWITDALHSNKILIGVPNTLLLRQWKNVSSLFFAKHNTKCFIVSGNVRKEHVKKFLQENTKSVVITTYASSHKVLNATVDMGYEFDMMIFDEAHHLTTCNMIIENTVKKYTQALKIKSKKQLALTATMKQLNNKDIDDDESIDNKINKDIVSNDNKKYFGEVIDRKTLLWAIEKKLVCDHVVQTIVIDKKNITNDMMLDIFSENDRRIFMAAYASLRSIYDGNTHHLLIYTNSTLNSSKIIECVKMLINNKYFEIHGLYVHDYRSNMKRSELKNILDNFESHTYGIISCVYCLGEGWNLPLLDGVVFAENMTSNIRIVQSALRASRKNDNEVNKINKIILPILNDNWLEDCDDSDFRKVKDVIYHMGLEDETISQKIQIIKMATDTCKCKDQQKINALGEYDDIMTELLLLKTVKRAALDITYHKAKKIIADKKLKNKEDYYKLCNVDDRLSKEPDIVFGKKFVSWSDYFSINREDYYDLETCRKKVQAYILSHPEFKKDDIEQLNICDLLCPLDNKFPPNGLWTDFYNVCDLRDITTIKVVKKIRIFTLE